MASGYFPLDKGDRRYDELTDIANELGVIVAGAIDDAWDLDCSDNAASDGGYITYLSLAKELIEKTLVAPPKERLENE